MMVQKRCALPLLPQSPNSIRTRGCGAVYLPEALYLHVRPSITAAKLASLTTANTQELASIAAAIPVPLDQPPPEYCMPSLYKTLFGNVMVEVLPALSNGFRFSAKRNFGDHAVQIGLQKALEKSELIA
jgi:hypothetical protein